jgi:hypothetical protein
VLRLLPVFLLTGCVVAHSPTPNDTIFKEQDRDWLQTYEHELKVAKQNGDIDAWRFFFPEYLKELKNRIK